MRLHHYQQVTVRSGKGDKDRLTTLSASLIPLLENHLQTVRVLHQQDLARRTAPSSQTSQSGSSSARYPSSSTASTPSERHLIPFGPKKPEFLRHSSP
jgi:hypothetical protein